MASVIGGTGRSGSATGRASPPALPVVVLLVNRDRHRRIDRVERRYGFQCGLTHAGDVDPFTTALVALHAAREGVAPGALDSDHPPIRFDAAPDRDQRLE